MTSGRTRTAPTLRVAENEAPRPTDRVFFNYNYYANVALVGGGTFGSGDGVVSGTFGPTQRGPFPNLEAAFLGVDASFGLRLPFSSALPPTPDQALPPGPQVGTPVVGFIVRSYFDTDRGRIEFVIHPTPEPTTLTYQRNYSIIPYVGLPLVAGNFFGGNNPLIVTPKLGINIENGDLTLVTNEAGPVTTFQRNQTRVGLFAGIDFDVYLQPVGNVLPLIGVGLFVTTSPDRSLQGTSAFPFDYRASVDPGLQFGVQGRIGAAFSASPR